MTTAPPSPDLPTPDLTVVEDLQQNNLESPVNTASTEQSASYVKLAMRNMVRKGGKSLTHFALTTFALLGLLVGLSYLTR